MFNFSSCSSDSGNDSPILFTSGVFESSDTNEAIFELYSSGGSRAAAVDKVSALTGKLEDGDMLFRLSGTYNQSNKTYKVSAASSIIHYTINGSIAANGTHVSTATLAVKDGSDWTTITVPVNNTTVDITATDYGDDQIKTVGFPSQAEGLWYDSAAIPNGSGNFINFEKFVISPLTISSVQWSEFDTGTDVEQVTYFEGHTLTVLELTKVGSYWDAIFASAIYDSVSDIDLINALDEYIDKMDLDITRVTNLADINNGTGIHYWIGEQAIPGGYHKSGYFFKGHSIDDFWTVEQFFYVNYLQTYLESIDFKPKMHYMKQRVEFLPNGNMVGTAYDHDGDGVFEVDDLSDIGTTLNPDIKRTFIRTVPQS